MRKQFVETISELFPQDPRLSLLLGDIGVFGFQKVLGEYPDRAFNIGILEQSTISLAAGLSSRGIIPIVHTIAPFIVERALEQLKIDFAYQKLGGNIVTVGASYDYAALGCTHHCPADVAILRTIPDINIFLPGSREEFDWQFRRNYNNGELNYFRLIEKPNKIIPENINDGSTVVRSGKEICMLVFAQLLDATYNVANTLDASVIYFNQLSKIKISKYEQFLKKHNKIVICVPFYKVAITDLALDLANLLQVEVQIIGIPTEFSDSYGTLDEHNKKYGLFEDGILEKLRK